MSENSPLRDHEKFWAFAVLIGAIFALAAMSVFYGEALADPATRILDTAVAGLIGIAGMSAQALFRFSNTEQKLVDTVYSQAESIPAAPAAPVPVEVTNEPVHVSAAPADGELPEDQKL